MKQNNHTVYDILRQELGMNKIKKNKNLFAQFTLHIDTAAEFYYEAKSKEDLKKAIICAYKNSIPVLLVGGGSNIAVTKKIIPGLIIKNEYVNKKIINENPETVEVMVSSGYPVSKLIQESIEYGYEGIEYHKGLPGTVGGAIYMNSKWTHPQSYFGDMLAGAILIDLKGNEKKVDHDYFAFGYDYSVLHKTHEVLLDLVFKFKKSTPDEVKKKADESLAYRIKTQPTGVFTAGCFFKNISEADRKQKGLPTRSAGYLIDKAGLKGSKIGNYYISDKHANFIINKGKGDPEDLMKLLQTIKKTVKEKFNIVLAEEVVVI